MATVVLLSFLSSTQQFLGVIEEPSHRPLSFVSVI